MKLAVVSNPRSHRNLQVMDAVRAVARRHPAVQHVELQDIAELPEILRSLARGGLDLLAINGGDGTVQAAMSALANQPIFEPPPPLALLSAGRTNLIAHEVGAAGRPDRGLARLIATAGAGKIIDHALLSLTRVPGEAPVHGMFFGTGAFYRATLWARRHVDRLGARQSMAIALPALGLLARLLLGGGRGADGIFQGTPMRLESDDSVAEGAQFILLATTLRRLMLGLDPFWGDSGAGLRYTAIAFPPRRLARAVLPLLRGRPRPWMPANGYRSGSTGRLSLTLAMPVVLDGEIFVPEPGLPVRLDSDRTLRFLRW